MQEEPRNELDEAVQQEGRVPLLADFWYFLVQNRKWWMVPILLVLFLMSVLLLLSSSAAGPFLYTLF